MVRHVPQDEHYVLITAFLSPAFCALGGAFVQILGGGAIEDYGPFWAGWYASNALGSLTLGPIAMVCIENTTRPRLHLPAEPWRPRRCCVLIVVCSVAFEDLPPSQAATCRFSYFSVADHHLVGRALGIKGASGTIFVISVVLTWRTLNGPSLFEVGAPETNVFGMQLFLIGLSPPTLLLGAAIEETRRAERITRESEERISFAAASSTSDFGSTNSQRARSGRPTTAGHCSACLRASPDLRQAGQPD